MSSLHPQSRRIASNIMLRGGEFTLRPIVEVDSQGVIISIGQWSEVDGLENTEFYAGIMCAGFVNAHAHIELSYLRGQIEPHKGFSSFAQQIGAIRDKATPEQRTRAIDRADIELCNAGVVAVGDIVNGSLSMSCKAKSPIKYRNFGEVFGLRTTSTQHIDWIKDAPNGGITPHSTYSLNDDIFRQICSLKTSAPLSIHFLESQAEVELFNKEGRLWEWYQSAGFECDFLHYGSAAQRIVSSIPADRSVILVHNCYVTQRDIDTIMSHFSAPVHWVLCPRSNRYISDITPPTELLRANGLNICIGTDSLASNTSLSIIDEILALGNNIPLNESLDWATRQGAKALQFDELGDIEVGKRPGINIISGVDYQTLSITKDSRVTKVL